MKQILNKRTRIAICIIISIIIVENVFLCMNFKKTSNIYSNIFKAYVETGANSNSYQLYSGTQFPGAGYYLNTTKSSCTSGGTISQASNYKINFTGSVDKCTLYFSVDANLRAGSLLLTMPDSNGIDETIPAGESIERSFTIQNTGSSAAAVKMSFLNLRNTYKAETLLYSLSYSETEDGEYKYINIDNVPVSYYQSTKDLATGIAVPANTTYYYKLRIKRVVLNTINQSSDATAIFNTKFKIESITLPNNSGKADQTLQKLRSLNFWIYNSNGTPDFSYSNDGTYFIGTGDTNNPYQEVTDNSKTSNGIYSMEDDYGTSYYFRGNVNNNYVHFAGLYWRIMRINGDGTLRLIYDGTTAGGKQVIGESNWPFNSTDYDQNANAGYTLLVNSENAYNGYMFGYERNIAPHAVYTTNSYEEAHMNKFSAAIKEYLDNWYSTNLSSQSSKIADSIFCNDRSIPSDDKILGYTKQTFDKMSFGYGQNKTLYAPNIRISQESSYEPDFIHVNQPILKCPQKNDAFTVSDTIKGNGRLTYPIGMATIDELVLAGNHGDYYTKKPSIAYMTMSPSMTLGYAYLRYINNYIDSYGLDWTNFSSGQIEVNYSVVPVINLTQAAVQSMTGNGTINNPFEA